MRLGLVVYSFKQAWCDAYGLMDRAAAAGFRGVEFPARGCLAEQGAAELARARAYAAERGLGIVADGGRIEEEGLRRWIPEAAALGAPVLRVIVSGIVGGNRRQMQGGWRAHLEAARDALRAVRPLAEEHDVAIAVENHQDIASDELLWLCEQVGGDHIGVTLDTGSTLALAEDPLDYTRRVKDYVKNVHLKDYKIYLTPTGYRLVRCALGAGVVDFPSFFALFDDQPDLPMSVELGAMQARHVEMLEDNWWIDYPPRRAQDVLGALRVVFAGARPSDEDWRTPHEREEPPDALLAYEMGEFEETVAYLRRVAGLGQTSGQWAVGSGQ
jgi:sugar phosphate isomerase/epimerase